MAGDGRASGMSRRWVVACVILMAGLAALALALGPRWSSRATSGLAATALAAAGDSIAGQAAARDSEPDSESGEIVAVPSSGAADIPFSHVLHAGKYGIDCLFCHGQAAHGADANLPAARDCYVCHWTIAADKPAILELERRVKTETPILWPASVRLPEHVQFPHEPHLRRGVTCAACHGNMGRRENAQPSRPLTMGFCVDCHRTQEATHDCMACHQ
jgi:cytochrome c7-like protein